jgi:NADH:ubiquinone oxidoreductase subunit 2 (subunit N)
MVEDEEILNMLQEIGGMLGFASNEMAWAYLGCMLVSLFCVIYGLIHWNRGEKRSRRVKRATKGKRPRRRR